MSKLIVFNTTASDVSGGPGDKVKLRGFRLKNGNGRWEDVDQQNSGESGGLALIGDGAKCELHRRKGVSQGNAPKQGDKKTILMEVHASGGVIQFAKVRSRPKMRKRRQDAGDKEAEFEPSMHNCKRRVEVTERNADGKPTKLKYTILKKGALGYGARLELMIHAQKS